MNMTTNPLVHTTGVKLSTEEGGVGFERDEKSELFIAAVSSLLQDTAYEAGNAREERMKTLTRHVTLEDPMWVFRFIRWLRDEANIRSAAVLVACEFVWARLDAGVEDETGTASPGLNRTAVNIACLRADEPGLVLDYWIRNYGRRVPKPVKRGVADAVKRLYTERSALKYDTEGGKGSLRMGDVIELTHPSKKGDWQGALYEWLLNRRHGHKETSEVVLSLLPTVRASLEMRPTTDEERAAERERLLTEPGAIAGQGMTWEQLSSLGPMDARAWEAMIPSMGYMALLRNLRNFDEAGINDAAVEAVRQRLADPDAVKASRQFPFRFYSAYKAAGPRWEKTLKTALELSLGNVPALGGKTLILVDRSGSMFVSMSERSRVTWAEQAALFGTALAARAEDPVLVQYGTDNKRVTLGKSVLQTMGAFGSLGGTNTAGATQEWLDREGPFDRVVIVTDEQSHYGLWGRPVNEIVPEETMLYTWNLAGFRVAHGESGPTRHTFGGLTDQAFGLIPLIEAGARADWPF